MEKRIGTGSFTMGLALILGIISNNAAISSSTGGDGNQPILYVTDKLFDTSDDKSLGLPLLDTERTVVYHATDQNWKFCHTPNLMVYNDQIYLMWSNGLRDEDSAGQRILFSVSKNGIDWSVPEVLLSPSMISDDPNMALMSAGWNVAEGVLTAYATLAPEGEFAQMNVPQLWALDSHDGKNWGEPYKVVRGLFLEGPKKTGSGWVLLGQGNERTPLFLYSGEERTPHRWQTAHISNGPEAQGWREPSMYLRPDG